MSRCALLLGPCEMPCYDSGQVGGSWWAGGMQVAWNIRGAAQDMQQALAIECWQAALRVRLKASSTELQRLQTGGSAVRRCLHAVKDAGGHPCEWGSPRASCEGHSRRSRRCCCGRGRGCGVGSCCRATCGACCETGSVNASAPAACPYHVTLTLIWRENSPSQSRSLRQAW